MKDKPEGDCPSRRGNMYNRTEKQFEWPGSIKPVKKDFCMLVMSATEGTHVAETPLQSLELSGFNEMVHIDHQKNCMTATG